MTRNEHIVIRRATAADDFELTTLAVLDGGRAVPEGDVLVAEASGRLRAALGSNGAAISDPFWPSAELVNMLRVQHERISSQVFPSVQEYVRLFGLTSERLKKAKPDVLVMHPGPINRGVELASDVADGPYSSILRQVSNGLAIRMAVLFLLNQTRGEM